MKILVTILITALLASTATWFALRNFNAPPPPSASADTRTLRFYQCAMHPQVRSDQPGRCTICGMELTPIYDGGAGPDDPGSDNLVTLTQNQIQVLHVQTATVKSQPLVRTLRVAGTIAENTTRHRLLTAYVEGRIDKLHLNFIGAEVTAGQPLAEFYSPTLLQAEREYRQLGGELRTNTALRLRQMGLTPAQIQALASKPADTLSSEILSPGSGTVVAQSVFEGQYVTAGEPLFEIADFSTMWFVFECYEPDLPWLKPGLHVRVTTPSLPGKSPAGTISFIDPNFNEATRSTKVRVELPNPLVGGRRELHNRLYADGMVELEAPSVLTVPRSAVIQTGVEAVVYLDQSNGAYEHRVIQCGRRGDTHIEVLAGLAENDQVVTNGNLLIDGQAEMNRSFMAPPDAGSTVAPAPNPPPADLTTEQGAAIAGFLKVADAMATALAADDLAAFNTASKPAMDATGAMVTLLRPAVKNLDALDQARHFHGFGDIQAARVAFHTFTVAATAALEPLRKAGNIPEFKVFECGMVNQAIPGVPKKARWIQTSGRAMANPFFGKEMSDCGEEINP